MNTSNPGRLLTLAILGTFVSASALGCAAETEADGESLGTSESQLVEDDTEASELDEDMETAEEGMGGATEADVGSFADGADVAEVTEKVRANAGKFFRPAGCITTTVSGSTVTHVFDNCRGPYESATFNGTISSSYVREPGKLTVTHTANDFRVNSASVSGSRVLQYTKAGSTITRTRTGNWTGKTGKGNSISHEANFVTTWDGSTRCIERSGSASTTIAGRSFSRALENYKRCGVGRLGCPESGKLTLAAKGAEGNGISVSLEFQGGLDYEVTRPNGAKVKRKLLCIPQK